MDDNKNDSAAAPAAQVGEKVETEMAERLRRIVVNIGEGPIAVTSKLLLIQAADECDRFYNGMMNWKANAQAKDRIIIELREQACAAAPVIAAPTAPTGVTLKAFKAAHDQQWCIAINHPYGTSWVKMGNLRDVQLAELIADAPTAKAEPAATVESLTRYAPDRSGLNMEQCYDGTYVLLSDVQDIIYAAPVAPQAAPLTNSRIIEIAYQEGMKVRTGQGAIKFARAIEREVSAGSAASAVDARDAARLDFMIEYEAFIAWGRDRERCRVFFRDSDGDLVPFMGWIPEAWASTGREAIDRAAMAATQEKKQ